MRNMKDSGIEWIGEIPEDWNIVKVKQIFNIGRGRVISKFELDDNGEYPVYSSQTKNNGCLGYIKSFDYDTDQLTWTTDGANAGTIFLRKGKHNCTNVCGTLSPKQKHYNLNYLKYDLEYIAFFHKRADTNGFKIMNNEMADIKILYPTLEEQELIADYLDIKVKEIDNIISKTKETIEEYKKYKQSVITEAVTKGLNPNVEMKDSGIEWIGEIPKDWNIIRLRFLCDICTGNKDTINKDENGLYPFYVRSPKVEKINSYSFDGEAILTAGDGVGAGKVFHYVNEKFDYHQRVYNLHNFDKSINARLLYYYLKENFYKEIEKGNAKSTVDSIRLNMLQNFPVVVPNNHQDDIIKYLDDNCNKIDSLISKKQNLITELEQYKKSLIYECVTGKKEVSPAYAD